MSPRASLPPDPGADRPAHPGLSVSPGGVVIAAPAKVNLFFEVLGRRPDGYHEVETLMVAVDLFDTLEVRDDPSGALTLACEAPGVRCEAPGPPPMARRLSPGEDHVPEGV